MKALYSKGEGFMNEFVQVAQKVVKAVSEILSFPISLSDEKGYIIGSTDESRIGTLHKPSKEVLLKDDFMLFDEEKVVKLDNVLAGVAVPLKFDDQTVGVLGIIGSPKEVKPHARLIKKYVEMTWQETFHKQLKDLERETLEAFLQYVLLHDITNTTRIKQYCEMLQVRYESPYFCIVVDIGDALMNRNEWRPFSANHSKEELLNCIHQAFHIRDEDICAFLNLEKMIVLKAVKSEKSYVEMMQQFTNQSRSLIHMLKTNDVFDVVVSAGGLRNSLQDVHESYYEAECLIDYGKRHPTDRHIYSYYHWDVLLELLPKNIDHRLQQKIYDRLKPLMDDESFEDLKRDFLAYCEENMIISKAAEKLFIHRNTLIYRLDKIERLTSLNIRNFQHCTMLYMALQNYEKSLV